MIASKLEERAKTFQRSLDLEEVKRKREEGQVELRKQKRSEQVAKKRALAGKLSASADEDAGNFAFEAGQIDPTLIRYCPSLGDETLPPLQRLQALLALLHHPTILGKALASLTRILASQTSSPPLLYVASSGVIPLLLQLLSCSDSEMICNSSWCLTNLSSGPSVVIEQLLKSGVLAAMLPLLSHSNDAIVDQTVWTLSNIAGDNADSRKLVIEAGVTATIVKMLRRTQTWDVAYVENMAWLLSNLCRELEKEREDVADTVLSIITHLITIDCPGVVANTCWILSYLTDGSDPERLEKVASLGVTSRLIGLTLAVAENQQLPALRTIGNLLTGSDSLVQSLLNFGILEKLTILVTSRRKEIRKEALWCYSNIAGGTLEQQKQLANHHSFGLVIVALTDKEADVRKEAVYVVANLTRDRDEELMRRLMAVGVLESLVNVLEKLADSEFLLVALEGIGNILRYAGVTKTNLKNEVALRFEAMGGLTHLEDLQEHKNEKVYEKVVDMMGEFYGMDDIKVDPEKEELQKIPQGGFQFS